MNPIKFGKWQKICIGLCGLGMVCSLLLLVPFVQTLILDFAEAVVVHRPLTRPVWCERFINWGERAEICALSLWIVVLLLLFCKNKETYTGYKPDKLFFCITISFLVISIFDLFFTNGGSLNSVVFAKGYDRFMDFFNHISYVRNGRHVYNSGYNACFPPLAYIFYGFICHILPLDSTTMYTAFATSSYALLLYIVYVVVLVLFFCYAVEKLLEKYSIEYRMAIIFSLLLSNVFVFGIIERGNSVFIVCVLLLRALDLKDSDNPYKRELALIFIAIAASFKIYPAIFGLLYIVEKRWKETARLVLYGVLFFFVPFVFFNGIDGFLQFLANQKELNAGSYSGINCIYALITGLSRYCFGKNTANMLVVGIVYIIFGALSVATVVLAKENWQKVYMLCAVMILVPFWSGSYTVFYLSLPFLLFINSIKKKETFVFLDYLFATFFALNFSFCTINFDFYFNFFGYVSLKDILYYLSIYFCWGILVVRTFLENKYLILGNKAKAHS